MPFGLIGAAIGGISSLLGGGDKEVTSRVDYKRMVRDAEAAGFNPLTAIRNGGSAGYTVTSHPGLSSGEMIGNALGHVGGFLQNFDPHAQRMQLLEADLAQAKIANLQADTYARQTASIGGVPSWTASVNAPGPMGFGGKTVAGNYGVVGADGVFTWNINANNTPAETLEEQYGDLGGSVVGGANLVDDWRKTGTLYGVPMGTYRTPAPSEVGGILSDIVRPKYPAFADAMDNAARPPSSWIYDWWNKAANERYREHERRMLPPALGSSTPALPAW